MPELRPAQVAHLAFYMKTPRCLDLSDPGCGKTPPACVYMYYHWSSLKNRSVWTMPKSLLQKNLDELLLFSEFSPEDVIIVDGTAKQRTKQMQADAKVFLMGFDCFSTNWRELLGYHPDIDLHVSDELHMGYGGPTSARTTNMFNAMKHIKYFLAMTGTIINGRLSSVYSCIQLCDPKLYPHGYDQFEAFHSLKDSYGKTVAWINPSPISKFLGRYGVRQTFAQAYGKEMKAIVIEACDMDPKQYEAYKEFEETALLELEDSWLEGTLPGVNFIRSRQLMEHPQTFGEPLDKIKRTGKEERLLIHLTHARETNEQMVVFSALVPSQERIVEIAQKLGLRVGLINGTVPSKRRVAIDEGFRAGEIDVIVASPATAAVGFNWGFVNHIVFTSLDCLDSSFVQAYRRGIRGVRKTPLLITVMKYRNSKIEDRVFGIIDDKSRLASDVDDRTERLDLQESGRKRKNMKKGGTLSMTDFT